MINEEKKDEKTQKPTGYQGTKRGNQFGGARRNYPRQHTSSGVRGTFSRIRSYSSTGTKPTPFKPISPVTQGNNDKVTATPKPLGLNHNATSQVFHSDRSPLFKRYNNRSNEGQRKSVIAGTSHRTEHLRKASSENKTDSQKSTHGEFGRNTGGDFRIPRRNIATRAVQREVFNKDFMTSGGAESSKEDKIRIIPLGGVEEIGKNMTIVEYKSDIIIVDMGFQFPGEETPGIDYIIPDTTYLQNKKKNIKGVFITHGHLDHIGGIPYMMEKLGNPTIYASLLASLMIKKRQDEFPHLSPLDLRVANKESRIKAGEHFHIKFFNVTHTIPESMGIIVETPHGNIVFTGDAKVDHNNGIPLQHEVDTYEKIGRENNLALLVASTNVERPGWSFSEKVVQENLKIIIAEAKGRLIIGTFASLLERIIFIIKTSEELGKKVVLRGRSMKNNVAIVKEIKMLNVNSTTIIPPEDIDNYPPNKIIILATGAQGDEMAALMRMSQKKDKYVKINKTDVVLLSSSIIPGNEKSVQKLKDNLSRQGAKIIHYRIADVHSSGHAYYDETLWMHKMIKPKFFIPIHGSHFALCVHSEIAKAAGIPESNIIIPDNGMVIEITEEGKVMKVSKDSVPSGVIMVDGLGNGDVNDVVIRDRQVLAQDGMFVIIAVIDMKTGKIRQSPDIISRGFVYLKESQDLLREVRNLTKKMIEKDTENMHPINLDYVKNNLREKIGKFLFQNTAKRPIILPVLLEV